MPCLLIIIKSSYWNVTFVSMFCLFVCFEWISNLFIKTVILKHMIKLFYGIFAINYSYHLPLTNMMHFEEFGHKLSSFDFLTHGHLCMIPL